MKTIYVIMGHETYWVDFFKADTIGSLSLQLDLSDYSTEAVMRMIIDKYGKSGEKKFQLNEEVMSFFFNRDKPDLIKSKHEERGDPWTEEQRQYHDCGDP